MKEIKITRSYIEVPEKGGKNMTALEQYAAIKEQIKIFEHQLEGLEPKVLDALMEAEGERIEAPFGTFTTVTRKEWKYSDELREKLEAVKEKAKAYKKEEERSGKATLEAVKTIIRFQARKETNVINK